MSGEHGGGKQPPPDPLSLIDRFANDEQSVAREIFLAPYVPGSKVRIKLRGVVWELSVKDAHVLGDKGGFALFQMTEPNQATVVDKAKRSQVDAYLKLLPRLTFVSIDEY